MRDSRGLTGRSRIEPTKDVTPRFRLLPAIHHGADPLKGLATCAGHLPRHSCFLTRSGHASFLGSHLRFSQAQYRYIPSPRMLCSGRGLLPEKLPVLRLTPRYLEDCCIDSSETEHYTRLRSRINQRHVPDICPSLPFLIVRFMSPGYPLYDAHREVPTTIPPEV